jgi:thymidylate synthase (FAD)
MAHTIYDPLGDGLSALQLVEFMGGDHAVVNDARASFDKDEISHLGDKDIKLIKYLIDNDHTSPLRGTVLKFKVKAPLFVARQWWKHIIASNHNDEQLGWNEKSFRYVPIDDGSEFYIPQEFRRQSQSNRQASLCALETDDNALARDIYTQQCMESYNAYRALLETGVGREQARGVLVPSVYTTWVWTASLQAVLHFVGLRIGHGAQSEIVQYAQCVSEVAREVAPVTLTAWINKMTR